MKRQKSSRRFLGLLSRLLLATAFLSSMVILRHHSLAVSTTAILSGNEDTAFYSPVLQDTATTSSNETKIPSPYAYAFLLAGCDTQRGRHRAMLYSVLIATYRLRESGSKADVVALVQMSSDEDVDARLAAEDARLLSELDVVIRYIPQIDQSAKESFYTAMMEKFRILELVQYRRVIFMDSDVMPLCNLDYLFDLSEATGSNDEPMLKPNLILAFPGSPAHGGFFMLKPSAGDFEAIQDIIQEKERKGAALPPPHFDRKEGWGHVIDPHYDHCDLLFKHGRTNWDWYGVEADQGLLYYWTKYVKESVSIVIKHTLENWGSYPNGTYPIRMEKSVPNPLRNYTCLPDDMEDVIFSLHGHQFAKGKVPYRDFVHFAGTDKPWQQRPLANNTSQLRDGRDYWYRYFRIINDELNMGLDMDTWTWEGGANPLGGKTSAQDLTRAVSSRIKIPRNKKRR